jgi:phosphopantothenoylcysteine decarboxylase
MVLVTVIACGAPLAVRTPDVVESVIKMGWNFEFVATPTAMLWLGSVDGNGDVAPRSEYSLSSQRQSSVPRSAVIAVPITFNSVGKLATGIADTYAHAILAESLGLGLPLVIVPMVNSSLRRHPAWTANMGRLIEAGALVVDPATSQKCPKIFDLCERMDIVDEFCPDRLVEIVAELL